MRKTFLFITAILLFAGCAKEQLVDERSYSGPVTVVSATFESLGDDATKAAVTDGGIFTWQNGDQAAFTASAGSEYFTGTNHTEGATANFSMTGETTFTSNSFAFFPNDLITGQSTSSHDTVNVPTSRVWKEGQTNVAMYGTMVENADKFNFTHMGGLVRVKIKNVPTDARKFVFKTPGNKINGKFEVVKEGDYKVITTTSSKNVSEEAYTLTWTTAPTTGNTMCFYIPLPTGKYEKGFAFSLLDEADAELISMSAPQSDSISRKDLILMPSITLTGGEIEPAANAAVVANIPAGYKGDFLLPQSENVLLKIDATGVDHNITLKYDEGIVPTNLEIQVEGNNVEEDNKFEATLDGNLPDTHVDFTRGYIKHTELITSASTFAVTYPATVNTLIVKGGNVVLKGATVDEIVVDASAFADGETKAPVQIVMEKVGESVPAVTNGITAAANVIVAPKDTNITVKVKPENNAKVATEGAGTVEDESGTKITTTAAAKIDDAQYITLADAITAVKNGETIVMQADEVLTKGQTITLENDETFTLDLNGKTISIDETGFDFEANSTKTALRYGVPVRFAIVVNGNGTLNICDNSQGANGKIETKDNSYGTTKTILVDGNAVVNVYSGTVAAEYAAFYVVGYTGTEMAPVDAPKPTLNVEGGTIEGKNYGIVIKGNTGTLEVSGGNVNTTDKDGAAISTNGTQDWYNGGGCKISISGGTIKSTSSAALYLPAEANTEITGGVFEGTEGITVKGGSLSISNDAEVTATGAFGAPGAESSGAKHTGSAIYIEDTYSGHKPIVEISGGKFSSANNKAVEYFTNKADGAADKGTVTINGGTFSDESAIKYAAQGADITVKLQADRTAGTSVFVKADQSQKIIFDLNGHNYIGVGPAVGSNGTENQLFHIEKNNTFTLKNSDPSNGGVVSINTAYASAFRFIIQDYATLTLENVTLDGTNLGYSGKTCYTLSSNYGNIELKGNTSIKAKSGHIAFDVYDKKDTNGGDTKYPGAPTVTWSSTGTVDGTIELSGGTFKLGHDLAVKQPIKVITPANLDLGTYTLSATSDFTKPARGVVIVNRGGDLTINGTTGCIDATTQTQKVYAAVAVTEKEDSGTSPAKLRVEGGTLRGYYYGIVGNGDRHNTEITINGGTIEGVCTDNDGSQGIYHPQDGKLTITKGTISGFHSAVEVRAGTVEISDGTFTCTATPYDVKANGSGSTTIGAALAIAQHNTKKTINVNISNGTFNGVRAVALEDPQGNKDSTNVKVSISGGTYTATEYAVYNNYAGTTINISGGNFESTGTNGIAVYARLGSVDITNGTFENTSNDEATLHVGCPAAQTENLQPRLTISGDSTVVKNNATGPYTHKTAWNPLTVNMANQLTYKAVEISGGTFHGQKPENDDSWTDETHKKFLVSGYTFNNDSTNGWKVVKDTTQN